MGQLKDHPLNHIRYETYITYFVITDICCLLAIMTVITGIIAAASVIANMGS